jgi:hypothetical protein
VLTLGDASDASRLTPTQIGFYEVRSGQQKQWLAVNADPREADLAPLNADNVARWLALTSEPPPLRERGRVGEVASSVVQHSIGWHLLIAAAVLLLIELLLANYRLTIRRDGTRSTVPASSEA